MSNLKSSGRTAVGLSTAMLVLSSIAILLRLVAKSNTRKGIAFEDWCIIAAYLLFCGYEAVFLRGRFEVDMREWPILTSSGLVSSGGTLNKTQISLEQFSIFLKYIYVSEILFTCTITVTKISILSFFCTIFSTKNFRLASLILGILCLVWAVICLLISVFQCRPIEAAWDLSIAAEAHCTPYGRYLLGYESTNMALDVAILCLPIFVIRHLQLPRLRKIMVGGIFLLGGFVCIVCAIRLAYVYRLLASNPDFLAKGENWSTVELGIAITCACLPTYGPLLNTNIIVPSSVKNWYTTVRLRLSRGPSAYGVSKGNRGGKGSDYNQFGERQDHEFFTRAVGGQPDKLSGGAERQYPLNTISVERSVDIV